MEGLASFAGQLAQIFAVLLPTFLYTSALGLFLFGAWALWQQAHPHNPFRGKPWVPWVSLLLSGACASFPTILTKINISGGSDVTVSVVDGLTSYTPVTPPSGILGATPGATVLNVVDLFLGFFQAFGALACLFAVLAYHASVTGRGNRTWSGCGVQLFFGVCLINIHTIAAWVVSLLTPTTT